MEGQATCGGTQEGSCGGARSQDRKAAGADGLGEKNWSRACTELGVGGWA